MKGNEALGALLARLAASYGGAAFFSVDELREWPKGALTVLKKSGFLTKATPADSVTCNGCERQCHMPVEFASHAGRLARFVACDKPENIGRVAVPLERLERWQASAEAVAGFLREALAAHRRSELTLPAGRWEVGVWRTEPRAKFVLSHGRELSIEVAGHAVPVADILSLRAGELEVSKDRLQDCIANPLPDGSRPETSAEKDKRIFDKVEANRLLGLEDHVSAVAREEGITRQAIHAKHKRHRERSGIGSNSAQVTKPAPRPPDRKV